IGRYCDVLTLQEAFQRCGFCVGATDTSQWKFTQAFRHLDGSLLQTRQQHRINVVNFRNPSVQDFMEKILQSDKRLFTSLLKLPLSYDQMEHLTVHFKVDHTIFVAHALQFYHPSILPEAEKYKEVWVFVYFFGKERGIYLWK